VAAHRPGWYELPTRAVTRIEAVTDGLIEGSSWRFMAARMLATPDSHRPEFRAAETYVEAATDSRRRPCPDATARSPGIHDRTGRTVTQWTFTGAGLDPQSVGYGFQASLDIDRARAGRAPGSRLTRK
jgi:hypothetical protein